MAVGGRPRRHSTHLFARQNITLSPFLVLSLAFAAQSHSHNPALHAGRASALQGGSCALPDSPAGCLC